MLHLIYLNVFKHLFNYTIHQPMPGESAGLPLPAHTLTRCLSCCPPVARKKKIVRDYLKGCGFYSYDAAEEEEDPVKRWIGREVKRFLSEAEQHLPFLLQISAAPPEVCEEVAAAVTGEPALPADSVM